LMMHGQTKIKLQFRNMEVAKYPICIQKWPVPSNK